jgi:hypothetical protein
MSQMIKHLPSSCEALSSNPSTGKKKRRRRKKERERERKRDVRQQAPASERPRVLVPGLLC